MANGGEKKNREDKTEKLSKKGYMYVKRDENMDIRVMVTYTLVY
jgi:hypothetical protein